MNKMAEIFGKIFKDEKAVRDVLNFIITLVIILAVALLIGSTFFPDKEEEKSSVIFDNDSKAVDPDELYMEEEQRMSDILSQVKGVGDVKVMLTYGENENGENTVKGVVVVAQGAGEIITKNNIITAARSAFDIPVSRITVLESK